jgi:hypothetical protein
VVMAKLKKFLHVNENTRCFLSTLCVHYSSIFLFFVINETLAIDKVYCNNYFEKSIIMTRSVF